MMVVLIRYLNNWLTLQILRTIIFEDTTSNNYILFYDIRIIYLLLHNNLYMRFLIRLDQNII
jgi:hypothetical protein